MLRRCCYVVVAVTAAVGGLVSGDSTSGTSSHPIGDEVCDSSATSEQRDAVEHTGFPPAVCNIERVDVANLSVQQFVEEYQVRVLVFYPRQGDCVVCGTRVHYRSTSIRVQYLCLTGFRHPPSPTSPTPPNNTPTRINGR